MSTPEKVACEFRAVGDAPRLKRGKFKAPRTATFLDVTNLLRKQLDVEPSSALFVYCNQAFRPSPSDIMGELHDTYCMGMNKYLNFEIHPIVTETLKRYPRLWEWKPGIFKAVQAVCREPSYVGGTLQSYHGKSSVNICLTRHKSGAYCIQVLESRNGKAFAEILGEAILSDFTARFSMDVSQSRLDPNKDYSEFSNRLAEVFRNAIPETLHHLTQVMGFDMALVTMGDDYYYSTEELDKVSVLATLDGVENTVKDIMSEFNDQNESITIESDREIVRVYYISQATLVVKHAPGLDCSKTLDEVVAIVGKLLALSGDRKSLHW